MTRKMLLLRQRSEVDSATDRQHLCISAGRPGRARTSTMSLDDIRFSAASSVAIPTFGLAARAK